jgi:protein ImuA
MQALSASDIAALSKAGGRWRPGLTDQPLHSEIFAGTADASGAGLALALARDALEAAGQAADLTREPEDRRQVLWVQDRRAVQRSGRPYLHGLPAELRHRIIHVEAQSPEDALFALEEGLRCRDLACVIGEIVGNPRALDFTASRRLSLAAEKHGVALWLVRLEAEADLSSARMRWRVEAAPSAASRWNGSAPGTPAWHAELFRARSHAPGKWILSNEDGSGGAGRLSANRYGGYSATNGPVTKSPVTNSPVTSTQDSGPQNIIDLVRPTVGRSLAACGRG